MRVQGAPARGAVVFFAGTAHGPSDLDFLACAGLTLDVLEAEHLGFALADHNGRAVLSGAAPAALVGLTTFIQAVSVDIPLTRCSTTNVVEFTYE